MIYLPTDDLYYNARKYFRNNIMDTLPNDDREWKKAFSEWLGSERVYLVVNDLEVEGTFDELVALLGERVDIK